MHLCVLLITDRTLYPTFLRTYVNDQAQVTALLTLCQHFRWRNIVFMHEHDDEGMRYVNMTFDI